MQLVGVGRAALLKCPIAPMMGTSMRLRTVPVITNIYSIAAGADENFTLVDLTQNGAA